MSAYNAPLENLSEFTKSNFELKSAIEGDSLSQANKLYVDSEIYTAGLNYLNLSTSQTILDGAIKTFTSSPLVPTPTTNYQASTKKYTDDTVAAIDYSNYLTLNSSQTIASGAVKTFTSSPIVPTPQSDYQVSTKKYTDDIFAGINLSNYLTLNSSQTIASGAVKTFTSSPILPTPTSNFQGATKKYVDDEIFDVDVTSFVAGTSNLQNAFFGYGTGNSASYIRSTAIGYNALITASNQVVLGTSNTNVYVPYRMGIGVEIPTKAAVEIDNYIPHFPGYGYARFTTTSPYIHANYQVSTQRWLSIYANNGIAGDNFLAFSDRRIKNNIVDVPDNLALQQVRDIPCRYYEYIDKMNKGNVNVVGFIAQEVKEVLPSAIQLVKRYIPDEYRILEGVSWEEIADTSGNITYKMSSDLTDVSGIKYKFMVGNDLSENEIEEKIVGNADNTFTFDASYQNVFCFGKEVDDFHIIDKNQIFALHHSAIQEIDRLQLEEKEKVVVLETKNTALETKVTELETKNTALETKNAELQTQIDNIMTILNNNNLS